MNRPWNLEGRRIVNWTDCDWQPYPAIDGGETDLAWHPIRARPGGGDGYYLLKVAPGGGAKLHRHSDWEEFVVLQGELVDGDGRALREGDCVSYAPGSRHRTHAPGGCILLASIAGPIATVEGDEELAGMRAGRRIVNWRQAPWSPYPSLPETADPIDWCPIRARGETGEGFYLLRFPPGSSSSPHEHTGWEEFAVLEGTLTDPDGTVYRTGDCIGLPPGTVHWSRSEGGCVTLAMIAAPLRTLARADAAGSAGDRGAKP